MSTNFKLALNSLLFASFLAVISCDSGPKVIESEPAAGAEGGAGRQNQSRDRRSSHDSPSQMHSSTKLSPLIASFAPNPNEISYIYVITNLSAEWSQEPINN